MEHEHQHPTPTRHAGAAPTRIGTARLVLVGSLLFPLAFGLLFDGPAFFQAFPPVVIGSCVAAVLATCVVFVGKRWMLAVATAGALLVFLLAASDPTPGSMTRPSLGMQMSWGHAGRLAGLAGLVAGVIAFREMRGAVPGRIGKALPALAALVVGLALGIGGTTSAALADEGFRQGGTVVALEPDATVTIVESDDKFVSAVGAVAPGDIVRIVIENRDAQIHSFTTTGGPLVDVDNLGERTTELVARAPETAGEWPFFCKYHPEMRGVLRVG